MAEAETRWISCNACGANDFREVGLVDGWHIGQCAQCSLIYVNPIPFFKPTPEFSEMSRDFEYTRYMYNITPEILQHEEYQFRWQCEKAARITGRDFQSGKFLDVGCGSGASVSVATKAGWDAVGIDIDPTLIEVGRKQLNVDLRCGVLPDSSLEGSQFSFIRLRDVIEHLPNPYDVLLEIKRLLVPGGVVLIITPNEGGLPTRMRTILGMKRVKVATVHPPHHLHGFAPQTLKRIFDRSGLNTAEITTTTPVDPKYVTKNSMRGTGDKARMLAWQTGRSLGMGSVLVGWAVKSV
jgi:2-polyprenyl-3-methyl-5-hydroxy-6-metoxy-1,4-benzoquinol methylase